MVMVTKRLLSASLLLILTAVALFVLIIYKPPTNAGADITFAQVDLSKLDWSGQNEGEIVQVEFNPPLPVRGPSYPPFYRFSLAKGLAELGENEGALPLIPTLLPEGMNYADVYMGPVIDVCFSYQKAQDPRFSDIVIEISSAGKLPSLEERQAHASQTSGIELVQIGGLWVELYESTYDFIMDASWVQAQFYYNGMRYWMSARVPLTTQDLATVIGSMETP